MPSFEKACSVLASASAVSAPAAAALPSGPAAPAAPVAAQPAPAAASVAVRGGPLVCDGHITNNVVTQLCCMQM